MSQILDATTAKRMKIDQYRQRERCKDVELEQFLACFRVGFVSDSWAFLFSPTNVRFVFVCEYSYLSSLESQCFRSLRLFADCYIL